MAVAQKPLGIPIPKMPKVERLVIGLRLIFFSMAGHEGTEVPR